MMETRLIDLNGLIIHQQSILAPLLGEHISMALHLDPSLRPVKVDPSQIEQVVATLCMNARDAMPEGGTLTLRTWNAAHTAADVQRDPEVKVGDFVGLAVADTGKGMSPEVIERIFEPFFSMNDTINGTGLGLGLAMVYGVVAQHGGWLKVVSVPGHGSEFRVFLPAGPADARATAQRAPEPPGQRGNAQCLLVVEDEEAVRIMAAESLRENGYQVLEAANRAEAMAQYAAHEDVIELVFTDVVLPDGSGIDLASEIRAMRPDLKVLLTSGYVEHLPGDSTGGRPMPFLSKPYCIDAMLRAVHSTLHA